MPVNAAIALQIDARPLAVKAEDRKLRPLVEKSRAIEGEPRPPAQPKPAARRDGRACGGSDRSGDCKTICGGIVPPLLDGCSQPGRRIHGQACGAPDGLCSESDVDS